MLKRLAEKTLGAALTAVVWVRWLFEIAGPPAKPEHRIYTCRGCGKPLLPENAWMEDGCPCNSPKGINDL